MQGMRGLAPGLTATYDNSTGVTRSLVRRGGFLTGKRPAADATSIAYDFVAKYYRHLGLTADDIADYEVTDEVYSKVTGATHLYLRQTYRGLAVYNAMLHINIDRDGRVMSVNNTCMPDIAAAAGASTPTLGAEAAVASAAAHLGIQLGQMPRVISIDPSKNRGTRVRGDGVSRNNIDARLMWLPVRSGDVRLVWNFQVATLDGRNVYDLTVDAGTGQVWTRVNWMAQDSYRVYPAPIESPNHSPIVPPEDDRRIVVDPADPVASPFGWHDTDGLPGAEFTIHRGNNVHAYEDQDDTPGGSFCPSAPSPPPVEPECAAGPEGLTCDFDWPIDLAIQDTFEYTSAVLTNLFYWNNLIHDVQYYYGFDEAAGNFQQNNYGKGGAPADYVLAEAQDGSAFDNASMCTPPDGFRPTMQMNEWIVTNPHRDSSFDNAIIVHEYGHGISNRLVGGPSNVSCLGNAQQPGEGLSDWLALVYTAKTGDIGADPRGIATYVLGEPIDGPGIRTQRYSTDPTVNTHTYESINGMFIPHGVGEVWAQGAWEVYWALVDAHGFDPDLKNAFGGGGNQRALLYMNEGLKNTICSPTFLDVRDGMLQAASTLFDGQDVCRLWEAFAEFGMGEDAVSGGPDSTAPTNGFSVPQSCLDLPANVPPVAGFTSTVTDFTASFTSTSTDFDGNATIASLAWDFGDGTSGTGAAPSHVYTAGGTYAVTLTVTDDGDLSDSVSHPVTINTPPVAGFTVITTDLSASFTSTSTDIDGNSTIATFAWAFGDGNVSDLANPSHLYTAAGTYTVTLTVTDDLGLSDSIGLSVTVTEANQAPVLALIGDKTVGEGSPLTFTATATDADLPANTLTFSLADGVSGAVPAGAGITATGGFSWTPSEAQGPGTYVFDVVVSDNGAPGLSDSETITVTVSGVAAVNLTIVEAITGFDAEKNRKNRMSFTGQISLGAPFDPPEDVVVDIDSSSLGSTNKIGAVTIPAAAFKSDGDGNFVAEISVASQHPLGDPLRMEVVLPRSGMGLFEIGTKNVETDANSEAVVTLIIQVGARTGRDTVLEKVKEIGEKLKFPLKPKDEDEDEGEDNDDDDDDDDEKAGARKLMPLSQVIRFQPPWWVCRRPDACRWRSCFGPFPPFFRAKPPDYVATTSLIPEEPGTTG